MLGSKWIWVRHSSQTESFGAGLGIDTKILSVCISISWTWVLTGHLCCLTNATKIYLFIKSSYQNLNLEEFLDFTVRLWFTFKFFSSLYLLLAHSHELEISWFISLTIKIKTNKRGSSLLVIYIYMEFIHPHHLKLPKFPSLYANLLSLRCHYAQAGL